jgi:hypothetical protein
MPSGKGSTATDIQIAAEGGTAIDRAGIMASDALGLAVVCVSTEEVNISSFMCFFVDDSKNSIGNNEAISPWSSGLLMKLCEMRKERLVSDKHMKCKLRTCPIFPLSGLLTTKYLHVFCALLISCLQ